MTHVRSSDWSKLEDAAPSSCDRADVPSRAIACAPASGDHLVRTRFERSQPGAVERERLAATLGALLRSLRAERRLSTRALAVRSTVARSTITRLEAGERRPRPGVLAALAYGLDHENPGPVAVALQEAAGESLRPDTPAGERRRSRRLGRAQREVKALRDEVGRRAGHARVAARRLAIAGFHAVPIPPPGNLTAAQLDRLEAEMNRAESVLEESRRLDRRAESLMSTLAWPYHPLERSHLERHLEEP
ncbi:helix-turn-helix domain-containing protein [Streptosporangium sp. G11]|uniref:helix-turn-helix domain-containing protein n=1 Tax=Streptosporangium sp. G11 TaxID=3436926 RepID=UPI003EBBDB0F